MRLLILVIFFHSSIFSQGILQYDNFSELFGFEDKDGNSQLFYRQSIIRNTSDNYLEYNDIFRMDIYNSIDSLFLTSRKEINKYCCSNNSEITDIKFINDDFSEYLFCGNKGIFNSNKHKNFSKKNNFAKLKNASVEFHTSSNKDYIYLSYYPHQLKRTINNGETWETINSNFYLLKIDKKNNIFWGYDNDQNLVYSEDKGVTTQKTNFQNKQFFKILFDVNNTHIYVISKSENHYYISASSKNVGYNRWIDLVKTPYELFVDLDKSQSGKIFVAIGKSLFYSEDYGLNFQPFQEFEEKIVGLYRSTNEKDETYVATLHSIFRLSKNEIGIIKSINSVPIGEAQIIQGSFKLNQNYPNPFNPTTTITYEIKETSNIELRIYNILGRLIDTIDHGIKVPGKYQINYDGGKLTSGIYFYQLISGKHKAIHKMILLK